MYILQWHHEFTNDAKVLLCSLMTQPFHGTTSSQSRLRRATPNMVMGTILFWQSRLYLTLNSINSLTSAD